MKPSSRTLLIALVAFVALPYTVTAQALNFTNADVDYSFDLPDEKWKMTVKPSATTPNV